MLHDSNIQVKKLEDVVDFVNKLLQAETNPEILVEKLKEFGFIINSSLKKDADVKIKNMEMYVINGENGNSSFFRIGGKPGKNRYYWLEIKII